MVKGKLVLRPALAVIDMQNGFLSKGGSYDKMGIKINRYRRIIPNVRRLIDHCKRSGIPIVYTQAIRNRSGSDLLARFHRILPKSRRERIEKGHLCIDGTWDADIINELKPSRNDIKIRKRRDSMFQNTDAEFLLKSLKVNTLIFCGIDASICVETSLRSAFSRGFDVVIISDAVASRKSQFYKTTLDEVKEDFGLVLNTDQVIREFNSYKVNKKINVIEKYMS